MINLKALQYALNTKEFATAPDHFVTSEGERKTLDDLTPTQKNRYEARLAEGPDLDEQRQVAVLTRTQFIKSCRKLGILSNQEAPAAARGEWPKSFGAMLVGLSADEVADAEIEWAAATQVHYSHPLVQGAAAAYAATINATAQQVLDRLFDIKKD